MKNISSYSCNFLTIDPLSGLAAVLKVSLGLKLMGGFWRLSSQKTIESSNRSWLEASYRLRTFPWRHYLIPLFSFQGTILCTSSCKCTLHPKQGLNHFSVPWGLRPADATCPKVVRVAELSHRHWHWEVSCKQCRPCKYGCPGSFSTISFLSLLINRNILLLRASLHESWCHLSPLHTGKVSIRTINGGA